MELLKNLYRIYSPSNGEEQMRKFIKSYCKALGCKIERSNGNIYVTKGESDTYPCIAAHTDQVQHNHSKDFDVFLHEDLLIGYSVESKRQEGLGADDKNGIWVALKCLERYDVMKAAFFWGEEIGCCGSERADMKFFDDCRFVLQCDRRGGHDFINNISYDDLCSEEFLADIPLEEFGYHTDSGMMTDVHTLKMNGLGVSCCNMSCGYYNPHTDGEVTSVSDLQRCYDFVCAIIERCTKVYAHEYQPIYDRFGYGSYGITSSGKGKRKGVDPYLYGQEWEECYDEIYYQIVEYGCPIIAKDAMSWYNDVFPDLELCDYEAIIEDCMNIAKQEGTLYDDVLAGA